MTEFLFSVMTNVTRGLWASVNTPQFWDGVLFGIALVILSVLIWRRRRYEWASVSLNIPFNLGNISYQPRDQDRIVAWKLFVQLKSRKAALPFDEESDVIAELYDSFYELFPITRELLSGLPLSEVGKRAGIADLVLRVQNDGLRPHLTKWQASFRRWWDKAINDEKNHELSPTQVQRLYPQYGDLVRDLRKMNEELAKYAENLLVIAQAPRQKIWPRLRRFEAVVPVAAAPSPPEPPPHQEGGGALS